MSPTDNTKKNNTKQVKSFSDKKKNFISSTTNTLTNKSENYSNDDPYLTPVKQVCETITKNEETEEMMDLDSLFKVIKENNTNTQSSPTLNTALFTIVDICKVFSTSPKNSIKELVAMTISNCYGERDFLNNELNQANKLMYATYFSQLVQDTLYIHNKNDLGFLYHKNNRPVVVVTKYPIVENKYFYEKIDTTLKKIINRIDNMPDPSNTGKKFKINFLPDFLIDTYDKKKAFVYLCSKINLSDRLKFSNQINMENNQTLNEEETTESDQNEDVEYEN
jgi:hypothetical protein